MTTLDEVWTWYQAARKSLQSLERLAGKYWDDLPWDGRLGKDDKFRTAEATDVAAAAALAQTPLDDLAVALMFSVFEATVRRVVAEQVERAAATLSHPVLVAAAKDAVLATRRKAFAHVLAAYSKGGAPDLAEQVRQVRRYRNWVTHGRTGRPDAVVGPKTAYDRLREFLRLVTAAEPGLEPTDS